MKVFIIPDIHLKPWMFTSATELIKKTNPDGIVCLMDIPDDFKQQYNIDLYINTFDVANACNQKKLHSNLRKPYFPLLSDWS